jgi:hypothetical protein
MKPRTTADRTDADDRTLSLERSTGRELTSEDLAKVSGGWGDDWGGDWGGSDWGGGYSDASYGGASSWPTGFNCPDIYW